MKVDKCLTDIDLNVIMLLYLPNNLQDINLKSLSANFEHYLYEAKQAIFLILQDKFFNKNKLG
jgi:hypothetical protein